MPAGKAQGSARAYQELCRDVLMRQFGGRPYAGDGIDVAFEIAGECYHLDVALNAGRLFWQRLIVAECRQTVQPQKRDDLIPLAWKAERIREATGRPVAAFFMVSTAPQVGALKLATVELGLGGVVWVDGTPLPDTRMAFLRYDRERAKKLADHQVHLSATVVQKPSISVVVRTADGFETPPFDPTGVKR